MPPREVPEMTHDETRGPVGPALQPGLSGLGVPHFEGNRQEALAEGIRRAEAILFAAGEPLSASQIAQILPQGIEAAEVLMSLRQTYSRRGVHLAEVAGKWRFQTAQDLAWLFVETRQVQKKLGQAAMETLAIIAYGQPVTRAEIEAIRGVAVSKTVIDTLMETGWIRATGRRRTPGLPVTYGTTAAFLEHFGLESLDTLPGKADLEADGLIGDGERTGFLMPDEAEPAEPEPGLSEVDVSGEGDGFVTDYISSGPVAAEAGPDEEPGDNALTVYSYVTGIVPGTGGPVQDDVPGQEDIRTAVRRLRRESRVPEQKMESWRNEG